MMRSLKHKSTLIVLVVLSTLAVLMRLSGWCINVTPSMPRGVYLKQTGIIHRGDTVSICLTSTYQQLGIMHHYLERGAACQGSVPLIKRVLAIPGDRVTLAQNTITVNGMSYPYATRRYDLNHHSLQAFPRGTYVSQGYWLIGSSNPNSWDSRYWGEVKSSQIRAKLKPLITW